MSSGLEAKGAFTEQQCLAPGEYECIAFWQCAVCGGTVVKWCPEDGLQQLILDTSACLLVYAGCIRAEILKKLNFIFKVKNRIKFMLRPAAHQYIAFPLRSWDTFNSYLY